MMEGVRVWLLSILAVSFLCALADALMPKGPVKGVGKLVCGLVLAAAVVSPVAQLDLESGRQWLEDWDVGLEQREEDLKKQVDEEMKPIIEREYEAYIVDKAAQLEAVCTARVECRREDEGVYLPETVWISGSLSQQQREELTGTLLEELGLAPESLHYEDGEGKP